ncbi:MAG TPA: EAL domain-containing protein [Novosphingobium sp.]|nr:EAL domain-containing protein [Novosphingobium sp.]
MREAPAYPILANEAARLRSLYSYDILDTPPDARFDNLAEIASSHFEAPIALVSLVDQDRQWFKAAVGLGARQTPREQSFCAHAIASKDEVLIIEDAWADPRFANNPLVTGDPHIRFYAGAPILASNGDPLGTICVIDRQPRLTHPRDARFLARLAANATTLLELHRNNALLHRAAERDPLTGLANRRGLDTALDAAVAAALDGRPCGLLYIDLDHFKEVNDTYGHEAGDRLLCDMADRLSGCVRAYDTVARIGGDEFVILLPAQVDEAMLAQIGRRILKACEEPFIVAGTPLRLSASLGGALAPRHAVEPGELLRTADRALYAAKRDGRGQLLIAGAPATEPPAEDASLEAELYRAIQENQLFLRWQAFHDLESGEVRGYEALVRWHHPRLGELSPAAFIPLAEACGLSGQLDSWVLEAATREAAAAPAHLFFAVNISAYWMARGDIARVVGQVLERSGLGPHQLILEMTERIAIDNAHRAQQHMEALSGIGVAVALDDFGTGYSSLSYLRQYPFDKLKLDRSFVTGIEEDPRGQVLAAGILHLAETLGIGVIAEGIETRAQAQLLQAAGCRTGQGFLWGQPQAAPWLAK